MAKYDDEEEDSQEDELDDSEDIEKFEDD